MSIRLLSVIVLGTLLLSCEKEIELKTNSNKCIVANALITENEPIEVAVYGGVNYVGRKNSLPLENANLAVYCGNTLLEEISGLNTDSSFRTSVIPKAGETYSIKVDCAKYTTASAQSVVPQAVKLNILQTDSLRVTVRNDYESYESSGDVIVSITDTTSELRYYLLTITGYYRPYNNPDIVNSCFLIPECDNATVPTTSMSDIINHMFESSDVEHYENKEYILFSNQNWHGDSTIINFRLSHISSIPSDINVMSFTEDYYKYFVSKERQKNAEDDDFMFCEPISVYSNIKNGLGLFAGYSLATAKLYSVCNTVYEY